MRWVKAFFVGALVLPGCAEAEPRHETDVTAAVISALTQAERVERSRVIRDVAAAHGLANGILLAGIALAETGMAHCHSEATWACRGPNSPSCNNGPVIAGAGDGACELRRGGLGMFQFDAGTYEQTLAREGERILTLEGNIAAAVDFTVAMVIRSSYVDGVDTAEQALAWMNSVRVGGENYHEWLQTVTHYYNGCAPGACGVYNQRYSKYDNDHRQILSETGEDFWYEAIELPECEPIGEGERVIEETDRCFSRSGDPRWWNFESSSGHGGGLIWTHTTDAPVVDNSCTWQLKFERGGNYLLEVYTAAGFAQATQAKYAIETAAGPETVAIDQSAVDGFQSLGEHRFEAGEYTVQLADNTGEPYANQIRIACDALRLTGGNATAPGPMPTPDANGPAMGGDGGTGRSPAEGGCSVLAPGRAGGAFAGAILLVIGFSARVARRRRRVSPARTAA